MRILIVQESDWFDRGPLQSHHLLERLSSKGHEVRVIDTDILTRKTDKKIVSGRAVFHNAHKVVDRADITVVRPPYVRLPVLNYASQVYTHGREIDRQISEFKPDIIVGFSLLNSSLAIHAAKKHGIPFIYYILDELHMLVPQAYFRGFARFVESSNMKNADMVISINEMLREYTIAMGADGGKAGVLPAGVEIERFHARDTRAIRESLGIKENDTVLFYMGLMHTFSGLKELALDMARSDRKDIKLLILGKGDLWDEIQRIRKEKGLEDRILMPGWRPYDEVPGYILASDICLLPAHNNQIMRNIVPIKLYDYMAASKPVIATRLPGVVKEFGEDHGIVYIDGPGKALAKAIELTDNGMASVYGAKARKFVEGHSWSDLTADFEHILTDMVTGASR